MVLGWEPSHFAIFFIDSHFVPLSWATIYSIISWNFTSFFRTQSNHCYHHYPPRPHYRYHSLPPHRLFHPRPHYHSYHPRTHYRYHSRQHCHRTINTTQESEEFIGVDKAALAISKKNMSKT